MNGQLGHGFSNELDSSMETIALWKEQEKKQKNGFHLGIFKYDIWRAFHLLDMHGAWVLERLDAENNLRTNTETKFNHRTAVSFLFKVQMRCI